jgi:hypothetical protein
MADTEQSLEVVLKNFNEEFTPPRAVKVKIKASSQGIYIFPEGYGEAAAVDGEGSPIYIELWNGVLRVLCWDDINSEDPNIIDMEGAKESLRKEE